MKSPYIKGKDYVVAIALEIVYNSFHILEKSNQCTSRILYNSYSVEIPGQSDPVVVL